VIFLNDNHKTRQPTLKDEDIKQKTPFTHEEFYKRYYVHRLSGFAVTIDNGNVLLVQQYRKNDLVWGFPGGLIEKGEPIVEGMIREVKEETGILVEPINIIGLSNWAGPSVFPEDPYKHHFGTAIFFSARKIGGQIHPDTLEIKKVRWVDINDIQNYNLTNFAKKLVSAALEGKGLKKILEKKKDTYHYSYYFSA